MAKKSQENSEKLSPIPIQIKFPDWQLAEIEEAVRVSGKSKLEIIRLATEAGLEYLKAINYRVGKAAFKLCEISYSTQPLSVPDLRVAEEPDARPLIAHVETDVHGRLTKVDEAFTLMCGYSPEELIGKKPGSILQGAGTDPKKIDEMRAAIKTRRPCTVKIVNYRVVSQFEM